MNCSYLIWYSPRKVSPGYAHRFYNKLCKGSLKKYFDHPTVDKFYFELTTYHPEINDVPESEMENFDLCPWLNPIYRKPGLIYLSCVKEKNDYVHELVLDLARKYGLAVYNHPELLYPGDSSVKWSLKDFFILHPGYSTKKAGL
jgi:hypothetical protein